MLLSIYRPNKYLYLSERVSYWDSEFEGGEVGFVDFAEAEGVGDEAFSSFYLDEVFAIEVAIV